MFRRFMAPTSAFLGNYVRMAGTATEGKKPAPRSSTPLPPAFDIIKGNDADMEKGYMLRAQYVNNCVVLNYMKQLKTIEEVQNLDRKQRFGSAQNKVVVFLPTVFIARFLGVLEGTADKCDIASRTTQGQFSVGSEPGTFVLGCTTNAEGESMKWECTLDAPGALMMHRFMVQALHHNSGF